ncbi:MAG: HipA domain-containing protein [Raoultibacter sp.]
MSIDIQRDINGVLQHIGRISKEDTSTPYFTYDAAYLNTPHAQPLSFSLPLQEEAFSEKRFRPYFEGLLPEGTALDNLVADLGIRRDDYLGILAHCGLDCIGDVVVDAGAYRSSRAYELLSFEKLKDFSGKPFSVAQEQVFSRLSLAGTQNKCGLFHDDSKPLRSGWYRPLGGAPSNYILKFARAELPDLMLIEYLCLTCARVCGLNVPPTHLLDLGRPALCIKRFDRGKATGEILNGQSVPSRLHQEDLSQAFGLIPASKYFELDPSTAAAVALFLRTHSAYPARDIVELARIVCFDYLIGNCDNHLKNRSVIYAPQGGFSSLAPVYDVVSTTYYARFSRKMGMRIGSASHIDAIVPADFIQFAQELGISQKILEKIAQELAEKSVSALRSIAEALIFEGFTQAGYVADNMEEDMLPRLEVLRKVAAQEIPSPH